MTHRLAAAGALAAALACTALAGAAPARAQPAAPSCVVPPSLALADLALPAVRTEVAARRALVVLALGSAPTLGAAADGAAYSYPSRLEAHLAALLPGIAVSVLNKGAAHRSTHGMAEHLPDALEKSGARLVLWETGGREAARGMDVDRFASDLQAGLDAIHAAGADVILLDLQFAPGMPHLGPVDSYRQALHDAAGTNDVKVFERYALMTDWAQHGLDLSVTDPAQRTAVARTLFDCMALTLARAIAHAAR